MGSGNGRRSCSVFECGNLGDTCIQTINRKEDEKPFFDFKKIFKKPTRNLVMHFKEEDKNKFKWIVNSGCSYGVMAMVVSNPLYPHGYHLSEKYVGKDTSGFDMKIHEQTDNIVVIDVAEQSQSVNWISDSTIYVVTKLLEKGINPENIYCFIEWTEWDRKSFGVSKAFDINIDDFDFKKIGEEDNNLAGVSTLPQGIVGVSEFLDNLNISAAKDAPIGHIDGELYITPHHVDSKQIGKLYGTNYEIYIDECQRILENTNPEELLKNFLDSILKTQWFLKSKGVKYNCVQIKSNFSRFEIHDGIVKHKLTHNYENFHFPYTDLIEPTPGYNPKNNREEDLEVVVPSLKSKVNMIDGSSWWFYENDKYRKGGYDEWAIDTFKECGYAEYNQQSFKDETIGEHNRPKFNGHPSTMLYFLLWNDITTNCDFLKINKDFCKWFLDRLFEDYESDKFTENGLSVSRKFLLQITKKQQMI